MTASSRVIDATGRDRFHARMSDAPRAKVLCPNCGAPLPPSAAREAVRCGFCGLASVPVPVRPVAPGTGVPSTGLVGQPVDSRPSELGCPRCGLKLFEAVVGDVRLDGCGACGGIWVDNESSSRIVQSLDGRVADLALRASRRASVRPDTQRSGLPCPRCAQALRRVRVGKVEVDVDLCDQHGTWFDRDELTSVAGAFARPAPVRALIAPDLTPNLGGGGDAAEGVVTGALVIGGALTILGALLGGSKS